jgi:hypothetical protein
MAPNERDAVPIEHTISTADSIRQLPLVHLLPHSLQSQRLFVVTEEINAAVNRASINGASGSASQSCSSPQLSNFMQTSTISNSRTASTSHVKRSRKVSAARALQVACDVTPVLAENIRKQTVAQLET